jgi:hypothetical protein
MVKSRKILLTLAKMLGISVKSRTSFLSENGRVGAGPAKKRLSLEIGVATTRRKDEEVFLMALRDKRFGFCPLGSGAARLGSARGFSRFLNGYSFLSFCFSFVWYGGVTDAA